MESRNGSRHRFSCAALLAFGSDAVVLPSTVLLPGILRERVTIEDGWHYGAVASMARWLLTSLADSGLAQ
jgi:hypothetical protein